MNMDIYEVTREEYKVFLHQLNMNKVSSKINHQKNYTEYLVVSNKNDKCLCLRRCLHDIQEEKYYILEYPDDDESIEPKPILKLQLDTPKEVQSFFNIINQLQKEHTND